MIPEQESPEVISSEPIIPEKTWPEVERRSGKDRRGGIERRSGLDRRSAAWPYDHPGRRSGKDRRCRPDRRSGVDRRKDG